MLLYILLWMRVCFCCVRFSFLVLSKEISWEGRLQNDLFCFSKLTVQWLVLFSSLHYGNFIFWNRLRPVQLTLCSVVSSLLIWCWYFLRPLAMQW